MPTSVREYVLASVATRLADQITTATVERSRRAPVDTDEEDLPRLIVSQTSWDEDHTQEVGLIHATMGMAVTGYAGADTDAEAEEAVTELHADVTAALAQFEMSGWDVVDGPIGEGADFRTFDTDESAKPAGEFVARYRVLCLVSREARGAILGEFVLGVDAL